MAALHRIDITAHPEWDDPSTAEQRARARNNALANAIFTRARAAAITAMITARQAGAHSLGLPAAGIAAFEAEISAINQELGLTDRRRILYNGGGGKNDALWRSCREWLTEAEK